ncbi:MAG: chromate transporter [Oscillospiraceae bacterium]
MNNKKDIKIQMKLIFELFLEFFKIGAFTFGGGYAMLSIIQREVVENKKWSTDDEVLDMFAIAEATPGVIAINTATFVGYKIAGFWGAFFATLGVALPAFIIIVLITLFLIPFMSNKWVGYAFQGLRVGIIVLIFNAAMKLGKVNSKCAFNFILTAIAFLIASFTNINVIFVLIAGLIVGIVYTIFMKKEVPVKTTSKKSEDKK